MKRTLLSLVFILLLLLKGISQSLPVIDSKEYEQMKQQGTLPKGVRFPSPTDLQPLMQHDKAPGNAVPQGPNRSPNPVSWCSCLIPIDNTFSVVPTSGYSGPDYRNDDGSTNSIALPFTFCLYGTNYNSVFINNNGNLSFGASWFTFTSTAFPSNQYVMVAPFWADVDTRNTASGLVYYKITPTHMIVQWNQVGYYSMMVDKLNTFQVIITNGADAILPPGDNVAFCYGDMQWTTGAASSGVNGFGGSPATVGINKGDGINFIQMGQFNQAGGSYAGPYATNDGIDWLDNKSFYFNTCSATNIPPVVSGFNNCDTLKICGTGDTLVISGLFLSPENGQTTSVNINLGGTAGATVLTNTSGNTATASVMVIATTANAGNNIITFTATDNGTPTGVSVVSVNVFVDTTGISALHPLVSGNSGFCIGDSIQLSVNPTTYTYLWSNGSANSSTYVHTTGQYWVTSTLNGCSQTDFVDVNSFPLPTPVITGPTITACGVGTTTLTVDSLIYSSYHWSNGSSATSITVGPGNYTVTVTDANGCSGTSPNVTVVTLPPPIITALADTTITCGQSANLSVAFTGATIPAACGVTGNLACTGPVTIGSVGNGNQLNSSFSYPCAFGNYFTSVDQQFLYTPAQLNAAGIIGGKINQLDWNISSVQGTSTYNGYTIKMGCTNQTTYNQINPTFITGLNTVFPSQTVNIVPGINSFIFTLAFEWDGISNVVIEICFSNGTGAFFTNYTQNSISASTNTAYYSSIWRVSDTQDQCNTPNAFIQTAMEHPNVILHSCSIAQNPADFYYSWTSSPTPGNIADTTLQFTTGTPFTNTTYFATVVNINGGCSATDSVHVILNPINTLVINPVDTFCLGSNLDTLVAHILPSGQIVPPGAATWSGPGIINSLLGIFSPAAAGPGYHTIHCTIPPSACGNADTTIQIMVLNQFDPTITQVAPVCTSYPPFTLHAAHPGGSWSGYGITDTINGIFDPTLPGLVGYNIVTYTIYTPCFSQDTALVQVVQQLDATINPIGGPYCIGIAPFMLSSVGTVIAGGTDTWSGPGMSSNGLFNPYLAGPGTHTITHSLSAVCGDTATAIVTVWANPVSTISSDVTSGCEPARINFYSINNTPGGTCFWDFHDGHTSNNCNPGNIYTSWNGGVPYDVTLIYTDLNQCKDTVTNYGMITVFSQPDASFSVTPQPTDITQPEIHFIDHSTGVINSWTWTFGTGDFSHDQNPVYVYSDTGSYHVQLVVINTNGCVDTSRVTVIIDPILTVYIPNAFTPGDENGRNDEFKLQGTDIIKDGFSMQIFDRWGERLFYTEDFNEGWNGRKNNSGNVLELGVYVYKISLKDWKGLTHDYIGHVTLVK